MEGGLTFNFFYDADGLFYIHMERVYVVIIISYPFNFAIFTAVHPGETSGKTFGWSCQHRIVKVIFSFIFVCYFIHFHHSLVQSIPRFIAVTMSFAIECYHGIVSANEANT